MGKYGFLFAACFILVVLVPICVAMYYRSKP
jgi:hypothetical protein